MATALILCLLTLLSLSGRSYCLLESQRSESHRHLIKLSSLLSKPACSPPTSTQGPENRSLLKIVHSHSPCSKFITNSRIPDSEEILQNDHTRVESINRLLSGKPKKAPERTAKATVVPVKSGLSLGSGNYIVRVGFGTPTKYMSLIFDTGSDLTWIQCKPCVRFCHDQEDPIFNPSESISFSNVTCNTTECSLLKSATGITPTCGSSSTCVYGIQYGDQSYSVGYFVRDTVALTAKDVFHGAQFGCGQNNRGLFGKTAGLLGLGRDKLSFVSQTFHKYRGRFSYCLPSISSATGYLSFGQTRSTSSVKFTPMVPNTKGPSFYFLNMIAISVGDQKLPIPASVFASSGTIIDSGTVITRLPHTAYTSLRSSFLHYMSEYPSAEALSILDTCYNLTDYEEVRIPLISLHFEGGVALDIDPSGILLVASVSQVCLAFAGNENDQDVGIIGNKQQQKLEVIYDLAKNELGFGRGSCK